MEKKGLYIESTIPSYVTGGDSNVPLTFARQELTRNFWEQERDKFNLYVSAYVIEECGDGDPDAAKRRLDFIVGLQIFPKTTEIKELAAVYQKVLGIPDDAKMDSFHLAVCVLNRVDYLLTWNCTHFGPASQIKTKTYNDAYGLWTPALVTPETIYSFMKEDV
jgi:hypothetical protein